MKHPAVYSDRTLIELAGILEGKVLDPMAGTGKLGKIKAMGWCGEITCNELEEEWIDLSYPIDFWTVGDAERMPLFKDNMFDTVATSPTNGNRLADTTTSTTHISYRAGLGKPLSEGNTGGMLWGSTYRFKHIAIYLEIRRVLKPDGLLVVSLSNHLRGGKECDVIGWTRGFLEQSGFVKTGERKVPLDSKEFGINRGRTINEETILIMRKK